MARRSREDAEESILRELGGWIVYILLIIGLTYFIITFVGQRTRVSGSSMETTLQNGDNLIVDKISYRFRDPKRYDIIVFPYKYEENDRMLQAYRHCSDFWQMQSLYAPTYWTPDIFLLLFQSYLLRMLPVP